MLLRHASFSLVAARTALASSSSASSASSNLSPDHQGIRNSKVQPDSHFCVRCFSKSAVISKKKVKVKDERKTQVQLRRHALLEADRLKMAAELQSGKAEVPNKTSTSQKAQKSQWLNSISGPAGEGRSVLDKMKIQAPDLTHWARFDAQNVTESAIGQIQAFSPGATKMFGLCGLTKHLKEEIALSPRPATIVRPVTVKMAKILSQNLSTDTSRYCLVGMGKTGKSVAMLQAISYAQSEGQIVLYIPNAANLVNSSVHYEYDSESALFMQPTVALDFMSKWKVINKKAFEELETTRDWTLGKDPEIGQEGTPKKVVKQGEKLMQLCQGLDMRKGSDALAAVFHELSEQSRFKVLLAIDHANSLFCTSEYKDSTFDKIESFALYCPRLLLDYISGLKTFKKGTILISPTMTSGTHSYAFHNYLKSSGVRPGLPSAWEPSVVQARKQQEKTSLHAGERPQSHSDKSIGKEGSEDGSIGSAEPPSTTAPNDDSLIEDIIVPSPYEPTGNFYEVYRAALIGVKKMHVGDQMGRKEAAGIMTMVREINGNIDPVTDSMFLERYVANDGIAGEFYKSITTHTMY